MRTLMHEEIPMQGLKTKKTEAVEAVEFGGGRDPGRVRKETSRPVQAHEPASTTVPWSIDRYGRLIAGLSILFCTALSILHSTWWMWGALACGANLLITSLTDRCVLKALLLRLGAREREDIFLPGGRLRPNKSREILKEGAI